MKHLAYLVAGLLLLIAPRASAADQLGLRGGVGTDPSLGLAYSAGASWLVAPGVQNPVEIGVDLFYAHSRSSSFENDNEYIEETWLTLLAVRADILFGYSPEQPGLYQVAGFGVAAGSVEWEETSEDDPTADSFFEGTASATVLDLGLGYVLGGGLDLRVSAPILFFLGETGGAAAVVPTLTATATLRL